jgi:hypothetical protein
MRIQLSAEDRERFGCPDWLTIDLSAMTLNEMDAIQQTCGFDSDDALIEAWDAQFKDRQPKVDSDVEPQPADRPRPRLVYDRDVWRVFVWLGLRHAGVFTARTVEEMAASIVDLDCQVKRIRVEADPRPGKDQTTSSSTPSTTSDDSAATTGP